MTKQFEGLPFASDSRAYLRLSGKSKGKQIEFIFGEDDSILFWDHAPVAVFTGGLVYYLDGKHDGGTTKAIQAYANDTPTIRAAASDFDFILGSLLTKVGLPLTRRS